ncbi:MAG: ketose-bisphosphate aldolase [Erysipelotrichaceae bacterium]|nr:ketose-bisphosphate aldolase [Erysipelotrichaceae bacterium]
MLKEAERNRYAVGAFNIGCKDIMEAIIQAAEDEGYPAIIECSVPEMNYLGTEFFPYVKKRLQSSSIPFVLHLDHGSDLNTIKEAVYAGFNSVMIDASSKTFEDNVLITKQIVEYAHAHGVCVEGELGTIGNTQSSSCSDGLDTSIIYTDPLKAKEFCERSGVDGLAVAIGTSHGMYAHGQTPKLRMDILDKIHKQCEAPLVLHGGSGNKDVEIVNAIRHGITKINISSEVKESYFHALHDFIVEHPLEVKTQVIFTAAQKAAYDMIVRKMRLFYKACNS